MIKAFNKTRCLTTLLTIAVLCLSHTTQAAQVKSKTFQTKLRPQLVGIKSIPTSKLSSKLLSIQKEHQNPSPFKISRSSKVSITKAEHSFLHALDPSLIQVRIVVTHIDQELLDTLKSLDIQVERQLKKFNRIQAWVPIEILTNLENIPAITQVSLPHKAIHNDFDKVMIKTPFFQDWNSVVSEGKEIMGADKVHEDFGIRGSGVRVGVISNGIAGFGDSVSSHNLPTGFPFILPYILLDDDSTHECAPDSSAFITSKVNCKSFNTYGIDKDNMGYDAAEGTAMMEIVYDLAPKAKMSFANFKTDDDFISAMEWLAKPTEQGGGGADIIVDDISWYSEPFFEDGDIAKTAQEITDNGILFVSSAGNAADIHWQDDFTDEDGDGYLEYTPGNEDYRYGVAPGSTVHVVVQWNDDFKHPTNDIDVYSLFYSGAGSVVTDASGNPLELSSTDNNINGTHQAIEILSITNNESFTIYGELFIHRDTSDGSDLKVEFYTLGSSSNERRDDQDSIIGHAAAEGVITVGAIGQSDSGHDTVQNYSSEGPATINNTKRSKPNIVGIDAVSVTGNGGFGTRFYGTSAAAPHIAACLALMIEANPELSTQELKTNLYATATDIYSDGFDDTSGYGLADCHQAVQKILQDLESPENENVDEGEVENETQNDISDPLDDIGLPDDLGGTNIPAPLDDDNDSLSDKPQIPLPPSVSAVSSGCSLTATQTHSSHSFSQFMLLGLLFTALLALRHQIQ